MVLNESLAQNFTGYQQTERKKPLQIKEMTIESVFKDAFPGKALALGNQLTDLAEDAEAGRRCTPEAGPAPKKFDLMPLIEWTIPVLEIIKAVLDLVPKPHDKGNLEEMLKAISMAKKHRLTDAEIRELVRALK